jgi:flagellar biosynthetic protein FliR
MPGEIGLSTATLLGFLLTMVRIAGVFIFIPIPGVTSALSPARVILIVGITIALFPEWPQVTVYPSVGLFVMWVMVESALGIGMGLAVAFVMEAFSVGAQLVGVQAGYSFASTIDPSTQADSTVLIVLAQLTTGLLFFATGLDRDVIRIFARSLEIYPAGSFVLSREAAVQLLTSGSIMFSTGFRMALPLIAVMVMLDISLALLGRVNSQLQLLTIAFPIKMVVGLALMGWVALLFPVLLRNGIATTFGAARGLLSH